MADGFTRFPLSTFPPNNGYITSSFQGESPLISKAFQAVRPPSFLPQSSASTLSLPAQCPQVFKERRDVVQNNAPRFPPPLAKNQITLQHNLQKPGRSIPQVQRYPFQGQEFNTDRLTDSSPNFVASVRSQVPANNIIHFDGNLTQPANIALSFLPGKEASRNNYLQPITQALAEDDKSSLMTFSGPFPRGSFQGTLSLPVPGPVSFSSPVTGPSQIAHLAPPSEYQPTGQPLLVRQEEITSQEWVNNFVKERHITRKETQATRKCGLKISEAKDLLTSWLHLISELSLQRDKLAEHTTRYSETEWKKELEKAQVFKERIEQIQTQFLPPEEMKQLEEKVGKRRKKREWQKRRGKTEYMLKMEAEERKTVVHKKIDDWRMKIVAEHEAKRRAESVKSEAGGVLGEVKRKQTDATRAVELLRALRKLRGTRKLEAEVKGVYKKPGEEDNKRFNERVSWLEHLMVRRRELYEVEERTLKVMLAEEEEEKEKERREKERRNQACLGLSDPMNWFRSYYQQADHNLQSLLQIRQQWDAFLVPETVPGASRIPDGFVAPEEPSSKEWTKALIDKG